jgi:hypothetical protein
MAYEGKSYPCDALYCLQPPTKVLPHEDAADVKRTQEERKTVAQAAAALLTA